MFERSKNFSKCRYYVLPLTVLYSVQCFATTTVFIVNPKRVVAGIDRLANEPGPAGTLINVGTERKIALLKGRFIVACIGLEAMRVGPPPQTVAYSFPTWIGGIESQINPNTTVRDLAAIVERESTKTFTETVPIETMMRDGTLKHIEAMDRFLVQFVVSGFDYGVVTLIEINYELDWQNNLLIGPTPIVHLPNDGTTIALYFCGRYGSIGSDKLVDSDSYAHKRMNILAPTAFKDLVAIKPMSQIEAIRAVRALITIQGEVEPTKVGSGSTVVVLPVTSNGSILEYQHPLARTPERPHKNPKKNN